MVEFQAPRTDKERGLFIMRAVATARRSEEGFVPPEMVEALAGWLALAEAAQQQVTFGLAERAEAVRLAQVATAELEVYVTDFLVGLRRRVRRERLPDALFNLYGLTQEGKRPPGRRRENWLRQAERLVSGEEWALAEGYAPMCNPSAVEVAARLQLAREATAAIATADRRYDAAQQARAALRPQADDLIKEVVAQIRFATRRMDAPSQRRILRGYGARFIRRGREEGEGEE